MQVKSTVFLYCWNSTTERMVNSHALVLLYVSNMQRASGHGGTPCVYTQIYDIGVLFCEFQLWSDGKSLILNW